MVDVWKLSFHKKTIAHVKNLKQAGLSEKAKKVLDNIKADPFSQIHGFEKLVGDLKGFYSKRINIKHRIVYTVDKKALIVYICTMWTHYIVISKRDYDRLLEKKLNLVDFMGRSPLKKRPPLDLTRDTSSDRDIEL